MIELKFTNTFPYNKGIHKYDWAGRRLRFVIDYIMIRN